MKDKLDEADVKILRLLQADGRMTNADLARKIGLSPPSMLQRVRKLEEAGYIKGYYAELSPEALNYQLLVVAMVSLSLHQEGSIEQFRNATRAVPEILEVLHISGEYDFMLKVVAHDMRDYERIVTTHISSIKAVGKINSCFVLAVNKQGTALPL
ncbi:MAG: Lrp/AsnC family transcriptional regulator [Fimbriimonadaceae bacterium]|nr:Lrp/AsnC family transcriptional regulator [Fimbriimonadaceae bacterium]